MIHNNIKVKFNYIGSSVDLKKIFYDSINQLSDNNTTLTHSEFESMKETDSFCLYNRSYIISNINLNISTLNFYMIDVRSDNDPSCKLKSPIFTQTKSDNRLSSADQDEFIC